MVSIRLLLWTSFKEWFEHRGPLAEQSPFNDIRVEEIQEVVEKYQRNLAKCRKQVPPGNAIVAKLDTDIKGFSVHAAHRHRPAQPQAEARPHGRDPERDAHCTFNLDEHAAAGLAQRGDPGTAGQIILGISVQVTQEANLKLQLNDIEEKLQRSWCSP
jgi:hypothetical protein